MSSSRNEVSHFTLLIYMQTYYHLVLLTCILLFVGGTEKKGDAKRLCESAKLKLIKFTVFNFSQLLVVMLFVNQVSIQCLVLFLIGCIY